MKLDKDEFESLDQQDRIELLLLDERLEKAYDEGDYLGKIVSESNRLIWLISTLIIIGLLCVHMFGIEAMRDYIFLLINIFRIYLWGFIAILVIYWCLSFVNIIRYRKRKRLLREQFFNVVPRRSRK